MEGKGHPSVVSEKRLIDILHSRFKDLVKREVKENKGRTYIFIFGEQECWRLL